MSREELKGPLPLKNEEWREYEWVYVDTDGTNQKRLYRINKPQHLYYRPGGATHRIVDLAGTVHCIPAPGQMGCVLRWKGIEGHAVDF